MKKSGISKSAQAAQTEAAQAQAAAQAAQAAAIDASNNMTKNFKTDLANENMAQVVAGGSAANEDVGASTLKKKKAGAPLSSQLGIA